MSPKCYPMTIMPVLNRITEQLQGQRCLGGAKGDLGVKVAVVFAPPPLQLSPDGHHSPSTSGKKQLQ